MFKNKKQIEFMEHLLLNLHKYFYNGINIIKLIIISLINHYQAQDLDFFLKIIFDKILEIL